MPQGQGFIIYNISILWIYKTSGAARYFPGRNKNCTF